LVVLIYLLKNIKNCCSIHSKDPLTSAKIDKFEGILAGFNIDGLVKESISQTTAFKINSIKDVEAEKISL
jgi:hypothetical protein